jgi:hypothetical protein
MSEAIPGLELMTALQNQTNQGLQAMQFGIQARQNERQLGQADVRLAQDARRLDMAQEEFDLLKPARMLEGQKAMLTGEYIKKNPDAVTGALRLQKLTNETTESKILRGEIFDRLNMNPGEQGFNATKQEVESAGYNFASLTGLNSYSEKGVKLAQDRYIQDIDFQKKLTAATAEAQIALEKVRATADYEIDSSFDAVVLPDGGIANRTKSGKLFKVDDKGVRYGLNSDEVKFVTNTAGASGKAVQSVSGSFINPDGHQVAASRQPNGEITATVDGNVITQSQMEKKGYRFTDQGATDTARLQLGINTNAEYTRTSQDIVQNYALLAPGKQPGTLRSNAENTIGGIANALGFGDSLNPLAGDTKIPVSQLDAVINNIPTNTPDGALYAKMFRLVALDARAMSDEKNAISKVSWDSAWQKNFGFKFGETAAMLQNPEKVLGMMAVNQQEKLEKMRDDVAATMSITGGFRGATPAEQTAINQKISTISNVAASSTLAPAGTNSDTVKRFGDTIFMVHPTLGEVPVTTEEQLRIYTAAGYTQKQP